MENTAQGFTPSDSEPTQTNEGMLTKASSSAHAAVNSIAGLAEDATYKAKPVIDQVAAMAHKAVDHAADTVALAANWLSEQGGLSVNQKKLVVDTSACISAYPLKSLGIGVAVGFFLLGRVLRY